MSMNWVRTRKWNPNPAIGPFLVYCGQDGQSGEPIYYVATIEDGTWLTSDGDVLDCEVTHWAEIKPPTEDSQ